MTPKEKAKELYQKHLRYSPVEFEDEYTKKSCLITIDELINEAKSHITTVRYKKCNLTDRQYWKEVRTEIEKRTRHRTRQ